MPATVPELDSDTPERPRGGWLRTTWRAGLMLAGVLVMVLVLAWALLLWQILPRAPQWRDDLAQQATRALGVPVHIGAVQGRREGLWPVLQLSEVRLLDEAGQTALRLPAVRARLSLSTLSPWAWLDGQFRLGELVLVAPDLDVRRDPQGRLHVAGLLLSETSSTAPDAAESGSPAADWVLTQARIRIERGRVQWRDEWVGAPPLALTDVQVDVRNRLGLRGRHHDLLVQATPPQDVGQRFKLQASVAQSWWSRPSDWRAWSGTARGDWPRVDVRRWRDHVRLPVEVMSGQGALGVTLSLDAGRLADATLAVDAAGVRLRWQAGLPEMALRQLSGQWHVRQEAERTTLGWKDLRFQLGSGQQWPASTAELVWAHAALPSTQAWPRLDQGTGGQVSASHLDLQMLAALADGLPLPPTWRGALRDLAPAGVLENLSGQWSGAVDRPDRYSLQGRAKGLHLAPSQTGGGMRPGLAGADVVFRATEREGQAEVTLEKGWLAFPEVFDEPQIPVDRLQAKVAWQHEQGQWRVQVGKADFANADAQGQLEAEWRTSRPGERAADGSPLSALPGWLRMTGSLKQAQATRVWRYLPNTIPADTRAYVRDAFTSGLGEDVSFEVDGELNTFPFKDDVGGRFRVNVPLRDVTMAYVPAALLGLPPEATQGVWAPLSNLKGVLRFEGQRMLVSNASGRLASVGSGQFALNEVQGRIDDLGASEPRLQVSGQGRGLLGDALQFLARSPISVWTDHALDDAQAQGQGALSLALDIPLMRADDTQVRGELSMVEADAAALKISPQVPWLTSLRGKIAFTEKALDVQAVARLWGEPMSIQGARGDDGVTRFKATGRVSAQGLAQAQEYAALIRLAPWLEGSAPVQVQVEVGQARVQQGKPLAEVLVQSSLQGMRTHLPEPLNKSAASVWPLRVAYTMPDAGGAGDGLLIDVGNPSHTTMTPAALPWVHGRLQWVRRSPTLQSSDVRGVFSVIQPGATSLTRLPGLPERGVEAQLLLSRLDLDAWQAAWSAPVRKALPELSMARVGTPVAQADAAEWLPDNVTVQANQVNWRQRTLHEVRASLAHPQAKVWRLQLESTEAAGLMEWLPDPAGPTETGVSGQKLVARLKHLKVPPTEAETLSVEAVQELLQPAAEAQVPALDIAVESFEWRGLALGRFEVEAINRRINDGTGRSWPEWRLTRFRLGGPEAQLNAQGNWTVPAVRPGGTQAASTAGRSRSTFSFTLDVVNGGELLTRLGLPRTVRGAKGQLSGHVAWAGSPLDLDASTMTGEVRVRINQGQFLKVDPGAAKLLSVLSLQSLPRRLVLDFRDLFQEGFAFDAIDGDVKIQQGVASTRNLRMRGVQAVVLMEGQADLRSETQDLQVYVVPDVNAGAASLAYAAINPVVGLGTFVAQMLLRKQVAEAGTRAFHVTGSWSDPQVTRVLSVRELSSREGVSLSDNPGADTARGDAAQSGSP